MNVKSKSTPAQRRARMMPTTDLLRILDRGPIVLLLDNAGGDVRLVGRWVWITFGARPCGRVRRFLKAVGFRWNRTREAWQHSCGHFTRHAPYDPRGKYGSIPARGLADESAGAA